MQLEQQKVITVSQLNRYVKMNLDQDRILNHIFLAGEISNFTNHYKSGHLYFSLKDDNAAIKSVMFSSNASKLRFQPKDGMKVIVTGRVSIYEPSGQYQLYVTSMQPDGIGALNLAFEQLKEKLSKEGLFDHSNKLPLPKYPQNIGIITSETGAAIQDIRNVLKRRYPIASLILIPVLVQGDGSSKEICTAIQTFNKLKNVDVIILGRGGGTIEDLWPFNEEAVAYAIFQSTIPIISAVGHETDYTISDFVSDVRAPTPSAAAELCVPDFHKLLDLIEAYRTTILWQTQRSIENRTQKLDLLTDHSKLNNTKQFFESVKKNIDIYRNLIEYSIKHSLQIHISRYEQINTKLQASNPMNFLSRGFSYATLPDGKVIHSVNDVNINTHFSLKVTDGDIDCSVISVKETDV